MIITVCLLLILPSYLTLATPDNDENEEESAETEGKLVSKDEVVYATLTASGSGEELYIVNTLDVKKSGKIVDYGNYTDLKNLTDLSEIEQEGDNVELTADEGKFYYQGNMDTAILPWDFNIQYILDGRETPPENLAGKDGHLEIKIDTAANEAVDQVFYENYLLQISLALDTEKSTNIKSEAGMLANAGKNKQITFTVMPGEEGKLAVEADVVDFELNGIDITAVPSNISVDAPDTDELTSDIVTLSDAISEINDGVGALKDGAAQLNEGTSALENGSDEYQSGVIALDGGSAELVNGSEAIDEALETMSTELTAIDNIDLSELGELVDGLTELSSGLKETSTGLSKLRENYVKAYNALDEAMNGIPAHEISEKEIGALYESDADQEVVNQLVEVYGAALTAKGTYDQIKQAFAAVDSTLETVVESMQTMAEGMDVALNEFTASLGEMDLSSGVTELQEGIAALSSSYKTFHSGLVEYTKGVGQLANGYSELDGGIAALSDGTAELSNGAGELHAGTSELHGATSELPEQMTEEIDKMISEYDKSDFEVVSFVSEQNENVNSVQFVLKTEGIQIEEPEIEEEEVEEKSIWQRFLDLFS